jgi:hypothetical protein
LPIAKISPPGGPFQTDQSITFSAEGSKAKEGSQIVSYDWNFGDGKSGNNPITRHQYNKDGKYTVSLTVTDDKGRSATTSILVVVYDKITLTCPSPQVLQNGVCVTPPSTKVFGPVSYHSFAKDSPFASLKGNSDYFYLDNFEGSLPGTPGYSVKGGVLVNSASVDEDGNGLVDNDGSAGKSLHGGDTITFTFNKDALGNNLPNYAGIVLTANPAYYEITMEAYGADGSLAATSGPMPATVKGLDDSTDDRFVGFYVPNGIKALEVKEPMGRSYSFFVDHLQYAFKQ